MTITIIVLAALEFIGQLVQTVTGFGSNPIVISVGSHFYDMRKLAVLLVMVSEVQILYLFARNHKHIRWALLLKKVFPIAFVIMPIW